MDTKKAEELIDKFNKGILSPDEEAVLDSWYLSFFKDELASITNENLLNRKLAILKRLEDQHKKTSVVWLWSRIAVAAAAVAVIVSSVYFYNRHASLKTTLQTAVVNDIAPGKNGATITLANGKVIQLSDAKSGVVIGHDDLAYNDGSSVLSSRANAKDLIDSSELGMTKGGGAQALTASTARGQTYQFTLPDGTKVWLNADSKISFPSQFSGKERKILLDGEGYFEVVHNAKQPFRVESKGQVVEDIGTAFNINAYGDEVSVRTTLVEGEARVYLGGRHPEFISGSQGRRGGVTDLRQDDVVLKPNQQSVLTGNNQIKVTNVDTELAVAWKNNQFLFEDEELGNIMRMIGRWYNVEVVFTDDISKEKFGGGVSRFDKVSKVLKSLEDTGNVHFKIQGRKIYVGR